MHEIKDGDLVFIVIDQKRQWLRKVDSTKEFHTDKGFVHFKDMIGKPFGSTIVLKPMNKTAAILKPLPSDIVKNMRRESQIIYPEDIGLIIAYGGINSGSQILEAGVGSGTVTSIMAMYSGSQGHIYTHDVRNIAIQQSQRNLEMMNVIQNVTLRLADICEQELQVPLVDFIMLDLATPWLAIPKVLKYLKENGKICSFSPTIEQVKKTNRVFLSMGFTHVINLELIKRIFQIKPNASRPETRMIGHTGYITFATKPDIKFPPELYAQFYAPETIGFVLIYAGIRPQSHVLLISPQVNELKNTFLNYIKESETTIHSLSPNDYLNNPNQEIADQTTDAEQRLKKFFTELGNPEYDVVLFDEGISDRILPFIHPYIKDSAIVCVLSQFIESTKWFTTKMRSMTYYEVRTYELIKRQIWVDPEGSVTKSQALFHSGYITIGRKVIELPGGEEESQSEDGKIDWANMNEDDDLTINPNTVKDPNKV